MAERVRNQAEPHNDRNIELQILLPYKMLRAQIFLVGTDLFYKD